VTKPTEPTSTNSCPHIVLFAWHGGDYVPVSCPYCKPPDKGATVEAIWLRTDSSPEIDQSQADRDPSARNQVLRVLVKLSGDPNWRVAIEYQVSQTGQLISHISEGHAFDSKPIDPVTGGDRLDAAIRSEVAAFVADPQASDAHRL
jgi:hypothetical protein